MSVSGAVPRVFVWAGIVNMGSAWVFAWVFPIATGNTLLLIGAVFLSTGFLIEEIREVRR